MALPTKCLLLLFMIIVVHGDIVVDVEQNVHLDNCCNGCCPCNSCEYKCKKDVHGICRIECRKGETNSMAGCDAKNGDDCDLKCCIETEKGCWNPITLMWVENGTIAELGGCTCEICINGVWVPDPEKILKHCRRCKVFGEPHIQAFTKAMFAWQVPCIHALAQQGFTTAPRFGVFMDFEFVYPGIARVGPTTYKEEGGIVVELDPQSSTTVTVSVAKIQRHPTSNPTILGGTTTVWAWKTRNCIEIKGKHKMLIKLCPWEITIWAPKNQDGYPELGGLCSSNDLLKKMELVARDESVYSSPGINQLCNSHFGLNWQVNPQPSLKCPAKKPVISFYQKHCEDQDDDTFRHRCEGIVAASGLTGPEVAMYIEACMFDLCITELTSGYWQMREAYINMTQEARTEQINTIDCCQDETCKAAGGTCVLKSVATGHCDSTLCSGEECCCHI